VETYFTPFASLAGGVLIGLSAIVLLAAHGRIAGISGIVSRILPPAVDRAGLPQGIVFLVGLLLAAPLWVLVTGAPPVQVVPDNGPLLVIAGVLVGFGSVMGNGCTSGHGVCGVSRGSARSIAATITFMATAFVTVFVLRHVVGG
jgi:uncharacterized membrane protein YedE/YeeE